MGIFKKFAIAAAGMTVATFGAVSGAQAGSFFESGDAGQLLTDAQRTSE
ncbi:MAG: hypothetical protein ACFB9N_07675 [Geitlerinemataceae cyanobacterium]